MSKVIIRKARESDWDAFRSFLMHDQPIDSLEAAFKQTVSEKTRVAIACGVGGRTGW
jgi:hypothetical protein